MNKYIPGENSENRVSTETYIVKIMCHTTPPTACSSEDM